MASHGAPDYRTLASLSRVTLLYALVRKGSLTLEELAEAAQLHPNTAREHLHRLVDAGFVSSHTRRSKSRGRPKLVYEAAVDREDPVQAEKVRSALQRAEYMRWLLPVSDVTQAPTAMDRQVEMLEDHVDLCGFDATVDTESLRVTVHECPFESLARQHPEVCQVHFHLIDTALRLVDGPLEAEQLHRLDPEDGCSVDLRCRGGEPVVPA